MRKNILVKLGLIVTTCLTGFSIYKYNENIIEKNDSSTIEDLIKDTNFKLDFKNINELEFAIQDSTIDIENNKLIKSFYKNNKFNIYTNDSNKVSAISFTTNLTEFSNDDVEYIQKIYNFIFSNISHYLFEKTEDMIQNIQTEEYISSNKGLINDKGYTTETINLSDTSELKFTNYYKNINNEIKAYKITIDILQGSKY